MISEIVTNYKFISNNIDKLIEISGYRNEFLAKKMGITASTFSIKKQRKSFTLDEMEILIGLIENDDVEDFVLLQVLRNKKNDEEISNEEFKKIMKRTKSK